MRRHNRLVFLIVPASAASSHSPHSEERRQDNCYSTQTFCQSAVEDLKTAGASTLELDVMSSLDALKSIAKKARGIQGRVDVVVNSAGY